MNKKASFGLGCFWKPDEVFSKLPGVIKTTVGYSGGYKENPTYELVCSGGTGHAETVLVEYDPKKINYKELLEVFWKSHDPTQINRQGSDIGTQYRSVVFCHNDEQMKQAEKSKEALEKSGKYKSRIATAIARAEKFYPAEDYHQKYLEKTQ